MKYYFLVSFLPEIHWDDRRLGFEAGDLLAETWHFAPRDRSEIDLVRLGHDVAVLERLLAGREPFPGFPLNDHEFWREAVKTPAGAPDWIRDWLDAHSGDFAPADAETLAGVYYDHVLARSRSPFLKAYFRFERDMRNILAAWRSRRLGRPEDAHLVGEGDLVEQLGRSKNEDFGLARDYAWIERLLAARDPGEIADTVDRVLWEWVDGHQGRDPFAFDMVLAYFIKARLLGQRLERDPEAGSRIIRTWEGNAHAR